MADVKTVRGMIGGAWVTTSEENAKRLGSAFQADGSDESGGYSSQKVADLRAEIAKRNEGREEADLLSDEGNKAALVATLEADDNK